MFFMEFKIAEAIHAEREAERNRDIEGIVVRNLTISERIILALRSRRQNRSTQQSEKLAVLTQNNAIAR